MAVVLKQAEIVIAWMIKALFLYTTEVSIPLTSDSKSRLCSAGNYYTHVFFLLCSHTGDELPWLELPPLLPVLC